jgi:hypothetical protein
MLAFLFELGKGVPASGKAIDDNDIDRLGNDFKAKRHYADDDRVWASLKRFIADHKDDIKYAISGGKIRIKIYANEIINDFDGVFASIDEDCRPEESALIVLHAGCTCDYLKTDEYRALSSIITNQDDVKVLLDSYHVKNIDIQRDVDFVTFDVKDIVSKKAVIEMILKGIFILHPVL